MSVYVLSEADRDAIAKLVAREQRRLGNTSGRGREGVVEHEEMPAPEVYVARSPSGGIPALTLDELTGTSATDTPGSAVCDVYRVHRLSISSWELRPVTGLVRRVFNLGPLEVPGLTWLLATRDKYGTWLVSEFNDRDPLVRVTGRTTGPGEFTYRYTVKEVEVTGTLPTRNADDATTPARTWSSVVELQNRYLPVSITAHPNEGIFILHTAPNGAKYLDVCCVPTIAEETGTSPTDTGTGTFPPPEQDTGTGSQIVIVPCCEVPLPRYFCFTLSVTNDDGTCDQFYQMTLTWNGSTAWTGSIGDDIGGTITVTLDCTGATWTINIEGCFPLFAVLEPTCNPFYVRPPPQVIGIADCCPGATRPIYVEFSIVEGACGK